MQIMEKQNVIISQDLEQSLTQALERQSFDRLFVLTDTTTHRLCRPLLAGMKCLDGAVDIVVKPTDEHKNIESLVSVWTALQQGGATRHSLMVNLGGGMVTDLGGFAASTFKRGIPYINVPTTLLSMVDASVGGKTGINFGGLKNEIGVFCPARTVILSSRFLASLDDMNLCSGYAEMLKHGLISTRRHWDELVGFDLTQPDLPHLQEMIAESVAVKERIVEQDPTEKGIRKALNLGHTIGHAFESLALAEERTVLHGYAVAWGMICELYLSAVRMHFPHDVLQQALTFVRENYGTFLIDCKEYDRLYDYMTHDQKNLSAGQVNFTLLSDVGDIHIDQTASKDEIFEALDFYRDSMGC